MAVLREKEAIPFDYFTNTPVSRFHNSGQRENYHIKLFSEYFFGYKKATKEKFTLYNLQDGVKMQKMNSKSQFFHQTTISYEEKFKSLSIRFSKNKKDFIFIFTDPNLKDFWEKYLIKFNSEEIKLIRKLSTSLEISLNRKEEKILKEGYLRKFKTGTNDKLDKKFVKIIDKGILMCFDAKENSDGEINCKEANLILCSLLENEYILVEDNYSLPNETSPAKRGFKMIRRKIKYDRTLRFGFSDSKRTKWEFVAADLQEKKEWIRAINEGIQSAINMEHRRTQYPMSRKYSESEYSVFSMTNKTIRVFDSQLGNKLDDKMIHKIINLPGNNICADCGVQDPNWASLNLGVILCIECSGIHRKFGSNISKIKSLKMDIVESDQVFLLCNTGNKIMNSFWYSKIDSYQFLQPGQDKPFEERATHFRNKYINKLFISNLVDTELSNQENLDKYLREKNILGFYSLLLQNSTKDLELKFPANYKPEECSGFQKIFEWFKEN